MSNPDSLLQIICSFTLETASRSVTDSNSLSQSCPVSPQYLSKHVPLKTHMASDYRPLSAEREIERSSPSELDFMYDKATLDQAAIFIEDAIKVSESYNTCCLLVE